MSLNSGALIKLLGTIKETTFKTADGFIVTPGKAKPFQKQADEWKEGVMTIFAGNGHGSGFAIGENLILTNHHVIGESNKVVVNNILFRRIPKILIILAIIYTLYYR